MPARPARLTTPVLPDISGLPAALPWYEVDRRQGVQSFPGDPARALLDLWPVFRRSGAALGSWTGGEPPLAVLTHCWRSFKKGQGGQGRFGAASEKGIPELRLDQDERGWFIQADISLEGGIPEDGLLYWADLRRLPRLRAWSCGLWDFASDGLALLLTLGIDTFESYYDWFLETYEEWGEPEMRVALRSDWGSEIAADAGAINEARAAVEEEARQLSEEAPSVLGGLRMRLSDKDLAKRFERRIRRAAVGPQWVEWGGLVLTAVRDLGDLWALSDKHRDELEDAEGEYAACMFSLTWGSPAFLTHCEQGFNDMLNTGGLLLPCESAKIRGRRPGALERLCSTARTREKGLRALCEALAGFEKLAEQACGVIDDPR
jgi:hypothetical protein